MKYLKKILLISIIPIIIVNIFLLVDFYFTWEKDIKETFKKRSLVQVRSMTNYLKYLVSTNNFNLAYKEIQQLAEEKNIIYFFIDSNTQVDDYELPKDLTLKSPPINAIFTDQSDFLQTFDHKNGKIYYIQKKLFFDENNEIPLGVLTFGFDYDNISSELNKLNKKFIINTLIMLVIFIIVFFTSSTFLNKQHNRLIEYFLKLAKNINEPPPKSLTDYGPILEKMKEMAISIEKYQQELLEKEKMATIGKTTSMLAHDIRKPFSILKVILSMLPKMSLEQIKDFSHDLDIAIRKVESMLSDIMESCRNASYQKKESNITDGLYLSIKYVSKIFEKKKIGFYYDLASNIYKVMIDEQRMCRAFENIICNAFEFLPDENGYMWFTVHNNLKRNEIVINIGNSGPHISHEHIDNIFKSTFTLGKKTGTGLGLSIVQKIIHGHDGKIYAQNIYQKPNIVPTDQKLESNHGVVFTIILPGIDEISPPLKYPLLINSSEANLSNRLVKGGYQLAGSSEIDKALKALSKKSSPSSLLIIDDEIIYRTRVKDMVSSLGRINEFLSIYDATSYKEGMKILNHKKFDYIICDIDLESKEGDGFDILENMRLDGTRILVHSNRKNEDNIIRSKKLGAVGFCSKPLTESMLVTFLLKEKMWKNEETKTQ